MAREHEIIVAFDEFGWRALSDEARRQNVRVEELVVHAAMYYLSDLDTGRVATRVLREAQREEPGDEEDPARRFGRASEYGEEDG